MRDLNPVDGDEDQRLILTAGHLFDGVPEGAPVLFAPPGPEPPSASGQYLGTVRRRVPLLYLPSIAVDAAVIKPREAITCTNQMACGTPAGTRDLWVVDDDSEIIRVRKHGAATSETHGELMPAAATHYMMDVQARYSSGWWAYGSSGHTFAARGDSGAIVMDENRHVIGMVVAIEEDKPDAATFVHGIKQIFAALQITMP